MQFSRLPAGADYVMSVDPTQGVVFSPVVVRGIEVKAKQVTFLDDLLLGEKVVLRGNVIDERGAPIPGASVAAYTGGTSDMSLGFIGMMVKEALRFPAAIEETKTDEAGAFVMASLTPGTYRVATKRSGYALNLQTDLVVAPERAAGAITIVLGPSAVLRGRVTDEAGKPVAKAMVVAVDDPGRGFGGGTLSLRKDQTATGADGTYVLDTLNRGISYRFGVVAEGWAPVFDAQSTQMEVEAERDFTLVRGGGIAGTVVDSATRKPVRDARVMAIVGRVGGPMGARGGRGTGARGGAPAEGEYASTATAVTDENGVFSLGGLRPGPVTVAQVSASGYVTFTSSAFGGSGWGDVKAEEVLEVDVALDAGGTVTGKVTAAADGQPVPGAQVAVVDQMSMWSGYPTATTDEAGAFRVDGVRADSTFSVIATAPGFVAPDPWAEANQAKMPAGGGTVVRDVALASAGSVEGTVKTSRGEPVGGARVRTRAAPNAQRGGFGRGNWRVLLPGGGASSLTDGEGRFRLEDVPVGERWVVEAETDANVPSESEPFEVRAGETRKADVILLGAGTVRGRVIDDRGGIVAGARVRVGHLDPDTAAQRDLPGFRADSLLEQRLVTSDAEGWFQVTKVRPGQTLLKVEHEGYVTSYRRDLVVQPDATLDNHMVTLVKGETISGVVKGDDGRPVENAIVAVTKNPNPTRGGTPAQADGAAPDPNVEPSMNDRTDAQGRFTVENVPPGVPYTVLVWFAPGYRGFGTGDEAAIKRGTAAGSHDVEFALKKQEGPGGFPMPTPPPRPPSPPSGMSTTAPPAMGN